MIDREKVIKGLEHCDFGDLATCHECPYYQSHDCTDELKNDILALLKEQEPIAPYVYGSKEPDEYGGWYGSGRYLCGKCKMPIAPKEMFCRRCGQAVKWE